MADAVLRIFAPSGSKLVAMAKENETVLHLDETEHRQGIIIFHARWSAAF